MCIQSVRSHIISFTVSYSSAITTESKSSNHEGNKSAGLLRGQQQRGHTGARAQPANTPTDPKQSCTDQQRAVNRGFVTAVKLAANRGLSRLSKSL